MMDDAVVDTDDNNGVDDMDGDEWKDDEDGGDDHGDGSGDGRHDAGNDRRCSGWRRRRRAATAMLFRVGDGDICPWLAVGVRKR